ncbi:MAG TPA: aminotransferase class V-fold PLP-dependent enzyme [Beutenbergiaceae bacterium]|nr:aminotransferase class V-fold PLP-dependent enzyme [Beutenbergiaceae bacterium]
MDNWDQKVIDDFPYRQDWVYLQSAGAGLAAPGAAEAAGQYYRDVAHLGCDAQPMWHEPVTNATKRLSRLLSVPSEELGFFRNTSEVINLAANSFQWRAGDEIVVMADEYVCNILAWENAKHAGARLKQITPTTSAERENQILEAINPRTRAVNISHVHPWTGTMVDLNRIGQACREHGALLIVDGIQALGATPVDLTYVDVYGAGTFKWLMSGFGNAVGVFRQRAREQLTPIFRSYANPPPSTNFSYAAPNIPGIYVLDATLAYLEELGWQRIYQRVDAFAAQIIDVLVRHGIDPVTPPDQRAGIVSFDVQDSQAVAASFAARQVSVSDRANRTIVSPHFYNRAQDIDRFEHVLKSILAEESCI